MTPADWGLFLDDERNPEDVKWLNLPAKNWVVARNFAEFIAAIEERGMPSFISFDHDLADQHYKLGAASNFRSFDYSKITEKTGMCAAKWLVEHCLDNKVAPPPFVVHSQNTCGRENIAGLLGPFRAHCERERFGAKPSLVAEPQSCGPSDCHASGRGL